MSAAPAWQRALEQAWAQPRPTLLARLLQPAAAVYGGLMAGRAWAYRRGWLQTQQAPVPVLVVGNLVAGGGGKTPTVIALLPRLRALGYTPGVISRGHGRADASAVRQVTRQASAAEVGDEPLLIHLRTGAPLVVGTDRLAAAQRLCELHPEVDLLVTDDGLQHLRLARDAQLIVIDERGAGNGLLLPAGPLREPVPHTLPPHTAVLYTGGRRSTTLPGLCGHRQLTGVWPLGDWWQGLTSATPQAGADTFAALRGRPVLAVAGLARPEAFFDMLKAQGLSVQALPLADHAAFSPLPWPADTADVVLTEKDAIKLSPAAVGRTRVWVATLDFQPEPAFDEALRQLCQHLPRRPAAAGAPPAT